MKASPSKLYALFGIVLIIMGYIFDFAYVTTSDNFANSMKALPAHESWVRYAFELIKFYLFVQGFLCVALSFITGTILKAGKLEWQVFFLITAGSLLFLAGGLWEAAVGPVFKMEPPCYVLGTGLFAVIAGLLIETVLLVENLRKE